MALITYDDKVALNENASIPDVNKVNASDMNQIKTGVNTNETNINVLSYNVITGGNPIKTGIQEDNKDVYVKKILISSLPNATSTDYPASLPNNIKIVKIESTMYFANGDTTSLPYSYGDSGTTNVSTPTYRKNDNAIRIAAGTDRSTASAELKIYFTYTS